MTNFVRVMLLAWLALVSPSVGFASERLPARLELDSGGFLGASFKVVLIKDTDTVRYFSNPHTFVSAPGTSERTLKIPQERWLIFRRRLEEAKVWTWKKKYEPSKPVYDGTQWSVAIEWDGKKIESHGSNAFPEREQYKLFLNAVRDLLGGERFG